MGRRVYICLVAAAAALAGIASDEIQGSAADVLSAIREKAIGRVYAFDALISVPPTDATGTCHHMSQTRMFQSVHDPFSKSPFA